MSYRMPFGKHRGEWLHDLDEDYFTWVSGLKLDEPLKKHVEAEQRRRRGRERSREQSNPPRHAQAGKPDLASVKAIIDAGYRALAKKAHPDLGGSHGQMTQLNATVEWLREKIEH